MRKLFNAEFIDIEMPIDWRTIMQNLRDLNLPYWKPYSSVEEWKEQLAAMKSASDKSKDGAQEDTYSQFFEEWANADIDFNNLQLYNYFPHDHYPFDKVEQIFCEKLGIKHHRSWFSRIDPGRWLPWHWDVEPNNVGNLHLERYCVFLGGPNLGHVFMLGNDPSKSDCFNGTEHGRVIKWHNHKEWHAGANLGFSSKWMFHFVGIKE